MSNVGSDPTVKVLVFGTSLRADSMNQRLAALAWVEFLGEPPGTDADRVDPVAS